MPPLGQGLGVELQPAAGGRETGAALVLADIDAVGLAALVAFLPGVGHGERSTPAHVLQGFDSLGSRGFRQAGDTILEDVGVVLIERNGLARPLARLEVPGYPA